MPATKNGNHIYITGLGNTLASVASDINDSAFCDFVGGEFRWYGTSANVRYFRIRNGGELTVGNGEKLMANNATNDDTRFYVDPGGHLILEPGSTLDLAETGVGARPYFTYFYGRVTAIGTAANPILIQNFRRLHMYETQNNNNFDNDIWHFEHCTIGGCSTANNYAFYFSVNGKHRSHIFRNLTFDDTLGRGQDTFGFAFGTGGNGGYEKMTFENITFNSIERAYYNIGGAPIKVTNNSFNASNTTYHTFNYGAMVVNHRQTFRSFGSHEPKPYGQVFAMFDNCTYADANNVSKHISAYGSIVLFKNCTWEDLTGTPVRSQYGGITMLWTGNTFLDTNPDFQVDQNGEIIYVHALSVNVTDENSSPIEDAIIEIEQSEGKEKLIFRTNSNGDIHAMHGVDAALLTHKSQYGDNENTNIETWSDPSNSTFHIVKIYKEGYEVVTQNITMESDKNLNIQLNVLESNFDFSTSDKIYL